MRVRLTQYEQITEAELAEGTFTVGGGSNDALRLALLPPAILRLSVEPGRLTLVPSEVVRVDGLFCPAEVPRILLPGETVELRLGVTLQLLAEASEADRVGAQTSCVLKELLGDPPDPGPSRSASLICLTGTDAGRRYQVGREPVAIGRGVEADIRLHSRTTSRLHARVVWHDRQHLIEDLGGPNGVYLQGRKVAKRAALEDGAVIELGQTLLRYCAPIAAPEPEPAPESAPPEPLAAAPTSAAEGPDTPTPGAGVAPAVRAPSARPNGLTEWALIGLGVALAMGGLCVTLSLAQG